MNGKKILKALINNLIIILIFYSYNYQLKFIMNNLD